MGKLEALRRAGIEYVILSCGGSRESLRRFAHEIMPAFSDELTKVIEKSGEGTPSRCPLLMFRVASGRVGG